VYLKKKKLSPNAFASFRLYNIIIPHIIHQYINLVSELRRIMYLKLASIWRFWFFSSYTSVYFAYRIVAVASTDRYSPPRPTREPFFRRDDHPKGRQFARSSGHWKRRWRRGTTYTQHNNDWGYDVIIEYAL